MGGKSSKKAAPSQSSSFSSRSKSQCHHGYPQLPYRQPSQTYVPPPAQSFHLFVCHSPLIQNCCKGFELLVLTSLVLPSIIKFMGGKSSKKAAASRSSSFGSCSKSNASPQLPYCQPSQTNVPPPTESYLKKNLSRKYSRIDDNYESLAEVSEALAQAGLESSNLIIGIDFTKSNEWTGARSFQGRSLHHIGIDQNPYEDAISIIGRTLASFDEDNLIPCFGFGDVSTHDKHVFSFYPGEKYCEGFEEVLRRYRELVPGLCLSGPTSFAPVIEMATTIVEQSGGQYHVLLLIADGQVTRSAECDQMSQQEKKTVDAIVKASKYPLSIVLVGVGDGPWDMMKEFDDNIPARAFDNFQFVNFTEIMSKKVDRSRKEADFALAALMEIPLQYKATLELNLLGSSNGNAIERVPLPPPCSASASLGTSKLSQSSSFHPSAPYLKGRDVTNGISQLGKSSFGNHLCPICIYNPKDMAFGCGHQERHPYQDKALLNVIFKFRLDAASDYRIS